MPRGVKPETAVYNEHGQRLCEYSGCNRLHNGNGLCMGHGQQIKRGKQLSPLPEHEHKECSEPGCIRWVKARGQCDLHRVKDYRPKYEKRKRDEAIAERTENIRLKKRITELENYVNALEQLIKHKENN